MQKKVSELKIVFKISTWKAVVYAISLLNLQERQGAVLGAKAVGVGAARIRGSYKYSAIHMRRNTLPFSEENPVGNLCRIVLKSR